MKFYALFLIAAFATGGTQLEVWFRRRPRLLVAACSVAAASFYSMRIVS